MKKKILLFSLLALLLLAVLLGCNKENDEESTPDTQVYTIQYTDENGNHSLSVERGQVYSLKAIPQKTGYTFLGLFDMEQGGVQYVSATGNSLSPFSDNQNITLFPQFAAKEYTIVLDYQGAEVTGTRQMKVTYDSLINELPTGLAMENKEFTGWYTKPNKEGIQVADKYGVNPMTGVIDNNLIALADNKNRICLYAGFKYNDYTLTLYIGDSTAPEEIKVEWGTHISAVQVETRVNGNAVLTWSKSKNDSTLSNVFNGKVEGDMILYSCEYAPVIDFNPLGGEAVPSIVNRSGNTISLPIGKRENYTFMGWFDSNGVQFNSTVMPNKSMALTAKWQANIVFNENGGTEVNDITAPKGEAVTLPTPERAGFIFAGWYDAGGNKYESTAMPENSIVLNAKYYKIQKQKYVVLGADSTYGDRYYRTKPSVDSNCTAVDLSEIYNKGVRNIKVTAHYKSKCGDGSTSNPRYNYMSWYSEKSASDAYCVWSYQDKQTDGNWHSFTQNTSITLTSPYLYACRYGSYNGPYAYFYWTDMWIEVEYPDTSTLY